MNRLHHWLCRSSRWRKTIEQRIPWCVANAELGENILELGPGPGLTTDVLRVMAKRMWAIEIDPTLAEALRARMQAANIDNVNVVTGDATAMPFPDGQFSAAVSFTMLHHLPNPKMQDQLLREAWRVLRPGGVFVGSDSLHSLYMRVIHIGDTLVPVDPETFGTRLEAAGFEVVEVQRNSQAFRFQARRPA
jgi:ubiquinone/menaquinone biosynthesis C-methylase UbiE